MYIYEGKNEVISEMGIMCYILEDLCCVYICIYVCLCVCVCVCVCMLYKGYHKNE